MNIELKLNTVKRIKMASILMMLMLIAILDGVILPKQSNIWIWLITIILTAVIGTILLGSLIYFYKLLYYQCPACKEKWSYILQDTLLISTIIKSVTFFRRVLQLDVNKLMNTYSCEKCNYFVHKKSTKYILTPTDHHSNI